MWFEELMGFPERSPEQVRQNIQRDGEYLLSRENGRRVRCGRLETPSLSELRQVTSGHEKMKGTTVREVLGDVAAFHRAPNNAGALFQAASQFNLLEMSNPGVTPEEGVGLYSSDHTQGPACAIACGGGTILRNYFIEVGGQIGQTAEVQIDCLADLGAELGQPGLWQMRNGYALCTDSGLLKIEERLRSASPDERDALRGLLRIGVQHNAEVIGTEHVVTQVYGSALPVAYGDLPPYRWEAFARLVLEASYEATLLAAQVNGIETVYLTLLGGGVFGNPPSWIADSVVRALSKVGDLDVRIVSYSSPSPITRRIVEAVTNTGE